MYNLHNIICCIANQIDFTYICILKLLFILIVNNDNCFCYNIIIYNFDILINIILSPNLNPIYAVFLILI